MYILDITIFFSILKYALAYSELGISDKMLAWQQIASPWAKQFRADRNSLLGYIFQHNFETPGEILNKLGTHVSYILEEEEEKRRRKNTLGARHK